MPPARIAGHVDPLDEIAVHEMVSNLEVARWIRAVATEGRWTTRGAPRADDGRG